MSRRKYRKYYRTHNPKTKKITNELKEEYAIEVSPTFDFSTTKKEDFTMDWFSIPIFSSSQFIGYFALFIALLSLGFYPFLLGTAGIVLGVISATLGEKTIGYTAVGFSLFSLIFDLLYQVNVLQ